MLPMQRAQVQALVKLTVWNLPIYLFSTFLFSISSRQYFWTPPLRKVIPYIPVPPLPAPPLCVLTRLITFFSPLTIIILKYTMTLSVD